MLLIFHSLSLTQFLREKGLRRPFKNKDYRESGHFLFKHTLKIGKSTLLTLDINIKHKNAAVPEYHKLFFPGDSVYHNVQNLSVAFSVKMTLHSSM